MNEPVRICRAIIEKDRSGYFLFVLRKPETSHYPGHWEFPGGKLDSKETAQEGAERELREETGISATLVLLNEINIPSDGIKSAHLASCFGCRTVNMNIVLNKEHVGYAWLPYSEALKYPLTPETRRIIVGFSSTSD